MISLCKILPATAALAATLCLAACDPVAQQTITVKLNERLNARQAVMAVIEANLVEAGLQPSGSGSFDGWMFEAGGQKSAVSILVSYNADSREIHLSTTQAYRFRMTPKLSAVIETAKREASQTGCVQAIEVR